MSDQELDAEILSYLQTYGAAAIPIEEIARAIAPGDEPATDTVQRRLISLSEQGRVRRSRVFPDRWLTGPTH